MDKCENRDELQRKRALLKAILDKKKKKEVSHKIEALPRKAGENYFSLSYEQKRLWLLYKLDPNSIVYNMYFGFRMYGQLNVDYLQQALNEIGRKSESLRTTFKEVNEETVQCIQPSFNVVIKEIDLRNTDPENLEEKIKCTAQDEVDKPFDLEKGPLSRFILIRIGESESLFITEFHHIIFDGWSIGVFFKELTRIYDELCNGNTLSCKQSNLQYADYAEWQKKPFFSDKVEKQFEYWRNKLEDINESTEFPIDKKRPLMTTGKGNVVCFNLNRDIVEKLRKYSSMNNCTVSVVLLAAYKSLIYKYTIESDITVGTAVANRKFDGVEDIIGFFVNTIVLTTKVDGNMTFSQLMQNVKNTTLEAYDNQEFPFDQLVERLKPVRDSSRAPFFQLMFNYVNTPREKFELKNLRIEDYPLGTRKATGDVTLQIEESGNEISGFFEYNSDLFYSETIERICNQYKSILGEVVSGSNLTLQEISNLNIEEIEKISNEYNNTDEYYEEKTIVELFEEQVEKTPDNIAVIYENEKITYREINQKANSLAARLREDGIKPNDFVAIISKRSIQMIIGILGIIKSGAAYVPIDPEYPKERTEYIISNCNAKAILLYNSQIELEGNVINLSNDNLFDNKNEKIERVNTPADLIYVIYTSGTTGAPKGVTIKHSAAANTILDINKKYAVGEEDNIIGLSSYNFDLSVYDIFGSLISGATLVVINDQRDVDEIKNALENQKITVWNSVPAIMNMFAESAGKKYKNSNLKTVMLSGDWIPLSLPQQIKDIFGCCKLISMGGATECSIWSIYYQIKEVKEDWTSIPYGMPLANQKIYVLDKYLNDCDIGVKGEICIGGVGLAEGYLNNDELTEKAFLQHPKYGRIYRTGDMGRMRREGYVEFLGRIDQQVKIRGFRIELEEIENVLRKISYIKDAVAVVKQDKSGDQVICAYVVSDIEVNINDIKSEIGKNLTEYMMPSYMKQIEEIPVTRNGKVNKKLLPDIKEEARREYIAPRNDTEKVLCSIFEEILNEEKIGINENFFELGGDSIKAIRIVSKVRNSGYKVTVKDIMGEKVISLIAKKLKVIESLEYEQGQVTGTVADTPIIKWFRERHLKKENYFNQAIMLKAAHIHKSEIKMAVEAVIKHHDILRSIYKNEELIICPVSESKLYDYYEYDVPFDEEKEVESYITDQCNKIQSSIDISNGPLVKIGVFTTKREDYLLICIHHLAIDGVSWRIISDDLETAYKQSLDGKDIILDSKTASYKMWSELIQEYASTKQLEDKKEYWNNVGEKIKYGKIMPQNNKKYKPTSITVSIDKKNTDLLIHEAGKNYGTEINDLLLSALMIAINNLTQNKYLSLQIEAHGREKLHKDIDIDRTVGWFTSIYPIVLEVGSDIKETIINTKEMMRRIPNHGIDYGVLKYIAKEIEVNEENISLSFNYLGELSENSTGNILERSSYSVGEPMDKENYLGVPIMVDGQIIGEKLEFIITYDSGKYEETFIKSLGEHYIKALKDLIIHCTSSNEKVKTASDFKKVDLSQKTFSKIESLLSKL